MSDKSLLLKELTPAELADLDRDLLRLELQDGEDEDEVTMTLLQLRSLRECLRVAQHLASYYQRAYQEVMK